MIIHLGGIDDNSTGPPDPLVFAVPPTYVLTTAHLLHTATQRWLLAASPQGSLAPVKGEVCFMAKVRRLLDINQSNNRPYALFNCVGGILDDKTARKKNVIASLLASIWDATQTNQTISMFTF